MASSRRRFLLSAAAVGSVALGGRVGTQAPQPGRQAGASDTAPGSFSPSELLAAHEDEHTAFAAAPAAQSAENNADYSAMYRDRRNWGRWGANDQMGAINLITPTKRAAAVALVRTGRTVSLSRVFEPPQHFMQKSTIGRSGGYVMDYLGFIYHGGVVTHIDALLYRPRVFGQWFDGIRFYAAASSPTRSRRT